VTLPFRLDLWRSRRCHDRGRFTHTSALNSMAASSISLASMSGIRHTVVNSPVVGVDGQGEPMTPSLVKNALLFTREHAPTKPAEFWSTTAGQSSPPVHLTCCRSKTLPIPVEFIQLHLHQRGWWYRQLPARPFCSWQAEVSSRSSRPSLQVVTLAQSRGLVTANCHNRVRAYWCICQLCCPPDRA
jgi:hypothetical protein